MGDEPSRRPIRVYLRHDSDVWAARREVRAFCERVLLNQRSTDALVTAVSELARNILVYAGQGEICVATAETQEGATVVVTATDDGPGIADLEAAMTDGYSSGGGLGLGLPSARRLVDKFSIISAPGAGTKVTLWQKLKTEPPR